MSYRFRYSKYKNIEPKVGPREIWIKSSELLDSTPINSSLIKATALFSINYSNGGNLSYTPLGIKGRELARKQWSADTNLSDFDTSPCFDDLVATASNAGQVKVWRFQTDFSKEIPSIEVSPNAHVDFSAGSKVKLIKWNPAVDSLISTCFQTIDLWDLTQAASDSKSVSTSPELPGIHAVDWKSDGSLCVCSDTRNRLNVWDPRLSPESFPITFSGHESERESRVTWFGDTPYILSSCFNSRRGREALVWDSRNSRTFLASASQMEPARGLWLPQFDPDSGVLFLTTCNGSTVSKFELNDIIKTPNSFGDVATSGFKMDFSVKSVTLIPKRSLKVMDAEVDRLLILDQYQSIIPISYIAPRKSYRDFHSDLFPPTRSPFSFLSSKSWKCSKPWTVGTLNLDPSQKCELTRVGANFDEISDDGKMSDENANSDLNENDVRMDENNSNGSSHDIHLNKIFVNEKTNGSNGRHNDALNGSQNNKNQSQFKIPLAKSFDSVIQQTSSPLKREDSQRRKFTTRTTKFRHLKGTILKKEHHVTNISGLCRTIPGECNYFKANERFCAVPIGNNNKLAIIKSKGHRVETTLLPSLILSGCTIGDFAFNPFDNYEVSIGCSNGTIKVWSIPEHGLISSSETPSFELSGHSDRVIIVEYHPTASGVLTSASIDMTIRIWDLKSQEQKIVIDTITSPLFGLAWNPNGNLLAVVSKDHRLAILDPRDDGKVVATGPSTPGSRGARVIWTNSGTQIAVIGFSKVSERQLVLYSVEDLSTPLATEGIDVNPAILIPYFDEDSRTLFLTGKGDSTVFAFEISPTNEKSPYVHHLSHFSCPTPHQALSLLPKSTCDVKKVEFARGFRLTNNSIEPVSFTVPRLRSEYFQDDIFPKTRITWKAATTSEKWFNGCSLTPEVLDLRPAEMENLSNAPPPPITPKRTYAPPLQDSVPIQFEGKVNMESSLSVINSGRRQQEKLVQSMSGRVNCLVTKDLPQKSFEGVGDEEWDDDD